MGAVSIGRDTLNVRFRERLMSVLGTLLPILD